MAKKSKYAYLPYAGPKGFIFMRASAGDMPLADSVASALAEKKVRLFYDCADTKNGTRPEEVASAIKNCERAIFILSDEACANRDFRNSINYALKEKKKVICIREEDFKPGYGLDIQLANVPAITSRKADEIVAELEREDFTPEMVTGEGLVAKEDNSAGKLRMKIMIAALAALLVAGGFIIKNRVDYLNSAEYQLKDIDNVEYLDISNFDENALALLDGRTIGTLYMEDMGLKDISTISGINVQNVDIAHNPDLSSLSAIENCSGIQSVTVSQDMLGPAKELLDAGLEVKVVR